MAEFARYRLVVLASGFGSNLQAVLDACTQRELPASVVAVFSDQETAHALKRAQQAGAAACLQTFASYRLAGKSRQDYDADLARAVAAFEPDLIILAGWMRLLSRAFLDHFPSKVINIHPALPGTFPGTHAIERAWSAFQSGEIQQTGVMVHFVPDEGVDDGPVILQEAVPISKDEDLDQLEARIHQTEHRLLVKAIKLILSRSPKAK